VRGIRSDAVVMPTVAYGNVIVISRMQVTTNESRLSGVDDNVFVS